MLTSYGYTEYTWFLEIFFYELSQWQAKVWTDCPWIYVIANELSLKLAFLLLFKNKSLAITLAFRAKKGQLGKCASKNGDGNV